MADECNGTIVRRFKGAGLLPDKCRRRVADGEKYCYLHDEQGDYERELLSAYAQHTAVY